MAIREPVEQSIQTRRNPAGPVPFLFGGRLCLDFVNTVNSRSRPATKDYLPDWQALAGWCRQTGSFDGVALERMQSRARTAPVQAEEAHRVAIEFREALYRIFRCVIVRAFPPEKDMQLFNHCVSSARAQQVLVWRKDGFAWVWDEMLVDLRSPACAVALSADDVLTREDPTRIKECPGPEGCGWLFYDGTKNGSRRWCSMEHCGGAAKARRYALRHRA